MCFKIWALAIASLPAALADQWPIPQVREVFSESREFFVRIVPGKSVGDTVGFANSPKGPYATAEFYRLEKDRSYRLTTTVSLANPVAPIDFFVTSRGVLITLDNWHNMGYGKVVAFYSAAGTPIRSYSLADLFNPAEIEGFRHSVSSIWWRESGKSYVRPGEETFYVTAHAPGAGFVFEANSGAYQYCETRSGAFVCRSSNADRKWQRYREPGEK